MRAGIGPSIARVLSGAWRASPPGVDFDRSDLERAAPALHRSGTAALGYRRLRGSALESSATGDGLRQAFRLGLLHQAVESHRVALACDAMRAAGVEAILGKGWAAARLYPEEGLRPWTDIDLYVRPSQQAAALALLPGLVPHGCSVDLHAGMAQLDDRSLEAIFERSVLVPLEHTSVRVFSPEDHLRLMALHMLGHGAWRPLWLCDLAAVLESQASFDWEWLFAGDPRRSEWLACALGLAITVLGARADDLPAPARPLPRWLVPALYAQWERIGPGTPQGARQPMAGYLRQPRGALAALLARWPNPIEATVGAEGAFDESPRWPLQVRAGLKRTLRFAGGLAPRLRQQR